MTGEHYVRFMSPGTLVSETRLKPIAKWDTAKAVEMSKAIVERHGARPFGFVFETRNGNSVKTSGTYYLGGEVQSLAEIEARNDPDERILRANMKIQGIGAVVVNTNSWRYTGAFEDGDFVVDEQGEVVARGADYV